MLLLDLLYMLVWRDIAIKYKESVMGLLWAVLMPFIIVCAGMLVRVAMSRLSNTPIEPDTLASIAVKSLPWAFFVTALRFATNSLTGNANLLTKINCPRIVFPVAAVLSSLFDLAVALVPLAIVLYFCGIALGLNALWSLPLLALIVLFVSGLGIGLSALNLFFRDVKYVIEVMLTFAIFFTPVFYETRMLGTWATWVLLNPMSPLLEALHAAVVLNSAPDPYWTAYSAITAVVVFVLAWSLFQNLEPAFADHV